MFQAAHPSAIVCPINKVTPAIIAWGLALLALKAGSLAPQAITPPPPAVAALAPLAGDLQFVRDMAP